jgi:hypothetical protein
MNYVLLFMKLMNHTTDLSVLTLLDNYIFIPIDFYSMFMFFYLCQLQQFLYFHMFNSRSLYTNLLYIVANNCQHKL